MQQIDNGTQNELERLCADGDISKVTRIVVSGKEFLYVVRCCDCENWGKQKTVGDFAKCALEGAWHGPEFYCANGVKRA